MEISIIVPVYNVSEFIVESLKSFCNQTFRSYEIIIVNDGTMDDSITKAKSVLESSNIDFKIINQENKGLPAARNTGFAYSVGKYVCFLDADDIISDNHLENLYVLAEKDNLNVCFSDFENTNLKNRNGRESSDISTELLSSYEIQKLFSTRKLKIHCCAMFFKNSFLKEGFFFNEKLKYGEDADFIWRVISHLDKIGHVKNASYKYLLRSNSIMTKQSLDKALIFCEEFSKTISALIVDFPSKADFYQSVFDRVIFGLLRSFSRQTDFHHFKKLYLSVDGRETAKRLIAFQSFKIQIFSIVLWISPNAFRHIVIMSDHLMMHHKKG